MARPHRAGRSPRRGSQGRRAPHQVDRQRRDEHEGAWPGRRLRCPLRTRCHNKSRISRKGRKGLPGLDDISKRFADNVTVSRAEPMGTARYRLSPSVNRLPPYLKRASMETKNEGVVPTQQGEKQQLGPINQGCKHWTAEDTGGWEVGICSSPGSHEGG